MSEGTRRKKAGIMRSWSDIFIFCRNLYSSSHYCQHQFNNNGFTYVFATSVTPELEARISQARGHSLHNDDGDDAPLVQRDPSSSPSPSPSLLLLSTQRSVWGFIPTKLNPQVQAPDQLAKAKESEPPKEKKNDKESRLSRLRKPRRLMEETLAEFLFPPSNLWDHQPISSKLVIRSSQEEKEETLLELIL